MKHKTHNMKQKNNKIYVLITIIIVVFLVIGFLMWWNHKKTISRKYQACVDKCEASYLGFGGDARSLETCFAECREKYGK